MRDIWYTIQMEKRAGEGVPIEHDAQLARIALSDDEKQRLERDIDTVLDYISQLKEVPTDDVEPTYHVIPLTNVFREDVVETSLPVEEALKNAPDAVDGFFRVPKII